MLVYLLLLLLLLRLLLRLQTLWDDLLYLVLNGMSSWFMLDGLSLRVHLGGGPSNWRMRAKRAQKEIEEDRKRAKMERERKTFLIILLAPSYVGC